MPNPLPPRQTTITISTIPTTITLHTFTDKILVTISQDGRLAQWLTISLDQQESLGSGSYIGSGAISSSSSSLADPTSSFEDDLLPDPHLTPRTLLGASTPEREATGQLFAVQIASAIRMRDPMERRALVLGLGLREAGTPSREVFFEVLEGVAKCLL